MHEAFPMVIAVIGVIAVSSIILRFASALAKRLEGRPPVVTPPDPAVAELREELPARLEALEAELNTLRQELSETRSEERRVGKSVDLGGRRIIKKKKKRIKVKSVGTR